MPGGSYTLNADGSRTLVQSTKTIDQAEQARVEIEKKTAESEAAALSAASTGEPAPESSGKVGKGGKNPKDPE